MSGRSKRKAAPADPAEDTGAPAPKRARRSASKPTPAEAAPAAAAPAPVAPGEPTAADIIVNNLDTFTSEAQTFHIDSSNDQGWFVATLVFPGPDGRLRVSAGDSTGRVYLYNHGEDKLLSAVAHPGLQVRGLAFLATPNGQRLLFVGGNTNMVGMTKAPPKVQKYNADTLQLIGEIDQLAFSVEGLAALGDSHLALIHHGGKPHGLQVSVASLDGQIIRTHRANSSLCCWKHVLPHTIATAGNDNKLSLYNGLTGESSQVTISRKAEAMAVTSNGQYLLIGGGKPGVQVWDLTTPIPTLAHDFKTQAYVIGLMPGFINGELHVIVREGQGDQKVKMFVAQSGAKVKAWDKFSPFDPWEPIRYFGPDLVVTKSNDKVVISKISAPAK